MQTKIIRLHSARRNPSEATVKAYIREMQRLIASQDRVIAGLLVDVIKLKEAQQPSPWGFDPRDNR